MVKDRYTKESNRGYGSVQCSPMKTKPFSEVSQNSAYLPLPERLSITKAELLEKGKELQEVKGLNTKLAYEVKSYRDKENQRSSEIENNFKKFNVDPRSLAPVQALEKYQELLLSYRQLMIYNLQVEESLRLEVITNEEQRAYITALKNKYEMEASRISPLPFVNYQTNETVRTQRALSPNPQTETRELEQRVERLARSETTLKLAVESLRGEIQEVIQERDQLRVQLQFTQEELNKTENKPQETRNGNEIMQLNMDKRNNFESNKDTSGTSQYETLEKTKEKEKLQEEMKTLKIQKEQFEEKLEKEKEEILKTLKEREEMINEMTAENNKLSQETTKSTKALNEVNQKLAVALADYEALKGQMEGVKKDLEKERKKVTQLEKEIKEKDLNMEISTKNEKLKEKVKIEQALQEKIKERDALVAELDKIKKENNLEKKEREEKKKTHFETEKQATVELENVEKENKALKRKVNILADRVSDLKEMENKNNQLLHDLKTIENELVGVCETWTCSHEVIQRSKNDDGKSVERISKRILRFIQDLNEKIGRLHATEHLKADVDNEGERKAIQEATKWKGEVVKAKEKIKILKKEIALLTETQEGIYARYFFNKEHVLKVY